MDEGMAEYIRINRIDSFQKLHFLLYLQRHPDLIATTQEFVERLHLGDTALIIKIVTDLQNVGLLKANANGNAYGLPADTEIRAMLDQLAQAYEDPFTRQQILDQVSRIHRLLRKR